MTVAPRNHTPARIVGIGALERFFDHVPGEPGAVASKP
jgi:hypothetical protein